MYMRKRFKDLQHPKLASGRNSNIIAPVSNANYDKTNLGVLCEKQQHWRRALHRHYCMLPPSMYTFWMGLVSSECKTGQEILTDTEYRQVGIHYQSGHLWYTLPAEIGNSELHHSYSVVISTAQTHLWMIYLSRELSLSPQRQEHLRIHCMQSSFDMSL